MTKELTFLQPVDEPLYSTEARACLRKFYLTVNYFCNRILETEPCSAERSKLIEELYAKAWESHNELDALLGLDSYQHGLTGREAEAAGLLRLCEKTGNCFEVGCGGGALCRALADCGWKVEGIDVTPGPDWQAITQRSQGGVSFRVSEIARDSSLPKGAYDLCIIDNCLEHIPPGDYEMVLKKSYSILRRGVAGCFNSQLSHRAA